MSKIKKQCKNNIPEDGFVAELEVGLLAGQRPGPFFAPIPGKKGFYKVWVRIFDMYPVKRRVAEKGVRAGHMLGQVSDDKKANLSASLEELIEWSVPNPYEAAAT